MPPLSGTRFLDYDAARRRMAEIIVEASRDPELVDVAVQQIQDIGTGDYASEAAALAAVFRDCIRYTADVSSEDFSKWPLLTLKQRAGDCNNKVLLFGALARAVGFPVRLCFLFSETAPNLQTDFPAHVFAAVDLYKGERDVEQWVPVELIPIPDRVSGFPSYVVPMGSLPPTGEKFIDYFDVDPTTWEGASNG